MDDIGSHIDPHIGGLYPPGGCPEGLRPRPGPAHRVLDPPKRIFTDRPDLFLERLAGPAKEDHSRYPVDILEMWRRLGRMPIIVSL